MSYRMLILDVLVWSTTLFAQNPPESVPLRQVHGQSILSNENPAAELTFTRNFRYLGAQRVNLYGNAEAEQHLFVEAGTRGMVNRFYWVQFEHFLPSNSYTYNYPADHTTDIGGLIFSYDVKSWSDYGAMNIEDPGSDGAAISRLLAANKLFLPTEAARVRMFYLPTPDHRTELMIIYGEAVLEGSPIQIGKNLDKDAPEAARVLLDHVKLGLTIHKH